jgi:dihydroorotate dehydrogenase electron transfer subunit
LTTDQTAPTSVDPGAPIRARAQVVSNLSEGEANHRIELRVERWPQWQPGQFVMLAPGAESAAPRYDPLLPRPMAIYTADSKGNFDQVSVLYKVEGRGTRLLAAAEPGEHVRMVGPLGTGFELPPEGHHAILVGGGTGTASLYSLARAALERGPVSVILGARRAALLMAESDFEKLGAKLHIVTEDGSRGEQGLVTDVLGPLLAEGGDPAIVYACGPTPMMRACHRLTREAGVSCRVALENRMACGFGACLGCAVPMAEGGFSLVCKQGPVYDADTLEWEGIP